MSNLRNKPFSFSTLLLLILLSCSKGNSGSNNPVTAIPNTFTYTVTDTLGQHSNFSDTSILIDNGTGLNYTVDGAGQYPAAYIEQPNTNNNLSSLIKFTFYDIRTLSSGKINQITFYLPFYQSDFSRQNEYGNSPLVMTLNNSEYSANVDYVNGNQIGLNAIHITTKITDSTGGFLSGTFNIVATTLTNKSISATGTFSHVLDNYHL